MTSADAPTAHDLRWLLLSGSLTDMALGTPPVAAPFWRALLACATAPECAGRLDLWGAGRGVDSAQVDADPSGFVWASWLAAALLSGLMLEERAACPELVVRALHLRYGGSVAVDAMELPAACRVVRVSDGDGTVAAAVVVSLLLASSAPPSALVRTWSQRACLRKRTAERTPHRLCFAGELAVCAAGVHTAGSAGSDDDPPLAATPCPARAEQWVGWRRSQRHDRGSGGGAAACPRPQHAPLRRPSAPYLRFAVHSFPHPPQHVPCRRSARPASNSAATAHLALGPRPPSSAAAPPVATRAALTLPQRRRSPASAGLARRAAARVRHNRCAKRWRAAARTAGALRAARASHGRVGGGGRRGCSAGGHACSSLPPCHGRSARAASTAGVAPVGGVGAGDAQPECAPTQL